MSQNVVYLNHLTFEMKSVARNGTYHVRVDGETLKEVRFLHEPSQTVSIADRTGQIVCIENTVFGIGKKWRYMVSDDQAVRALLEQMFNQIPTPVIVP